MSADTVSVQQAPLWAMTALDLAEGYRAGAFTPVDAIEAIFARLDAVNPTLNAVIAVDRAGSFAAAEASAARWAGGRPLSALDGVPISVKDNLFAKGLPATWGSRLFANFVPDTDEPAIALLRAAGAVLFGKTNVPEFTVQGYTSNLVYGTTVNPHALDRTPGGSTGGGAAAVAGGIGPLAIGTDGGGSIRRPAAHCGLYALKPSIGLVPRYGGFPQILADFEVIGVVGRSLADIETVRGIIEVHDPADQRSLAAAATVPVLPAAPRIAFMPTIGSNPVDKRITDACEAFAQALAKTGAVVETIEAPFDPDLVAATWGTVMTSGLAWAVNGVPGWQDKVNPSARALAEDGALRTTGQLLDALAAAADIRRAAAQLFENYDLLLCPATAALAWPANEVFPPEIDGKPVGPRGHAVFTAWMNVAGLPVLTVPVAMTSDRGGIGIQLIAGHGRDQSLIAFLRACPALRPYMLAPLAALD